MLLHHRARTAPAENEVQPCLFDSNPATAAATAVGDEDVAAAILAEGACERSLQRSAGLIPRQLR
jgi:hypothetical protein